MRYCATALPKTTLRAVHPTAAELLEELREPGESYEALAARLPISLSTVNRWKKSSPRDWDTILTLLDRAGWLSPAAGRRSGEGDLARSAAAAREGEEEAQRLAGRGGRPRDARRSA